MRMQTIILALVLCLAPTVDANPPVAVRRVGVRVHAPVAVRSFARVRVVNHISLGAFAAPAYSYPVASRAFLATPLLAAPPDCGVPTLGATFAAPSCYSSPALSSTFFAAPAYYGGGGLSLRAPFVRLRIGGY